MTRRSVMRAIVLFDLFVVLPTLYLMFWPVPVNPTAWTPPPAPPLTGVYAVNNRLAEVERLMEGAAHGPEDVALDEQGRIYGGMLDGRIVRMNADGSQIETFTDTGGRPLGLHFDKTGNLIVADAVKGLLSVNEDGGITVLATEAEGVPFKFTDDVDIAEDGTIYFSDASSKFGINQVNEDIIEHRPNGRLLAYDPETKTARVVLGDLYFANGVAVSPDQSYVLVNETGAYRIKRVWVAGPRIGESDIFIDNLPGFPDGISSNGEGIFWLAIYAPRNAMLDKIMPSPSLKKVVLRLPAFLQPAPAMYGFVLGLDEQGKVVHNLQDPSPAFAPITSVEQHGSHLYLGSLTDTAVGRIPAP